MTDDTFEPEGDGVAQSGVPANETAADVGAEGDGGIEVRTGAGGTMVGVLREETAPGHWVIKLSGLPGAPPGDEVAVGRAGANNHSPSISGHAAPDGASRVSIAWIESPAGDAPAIGRVMWQSFHADAAGATTPPIAANDNATWVTDAGGAGVIGCEPGVLGLTSGDTLVTWIGLDGHAHGRLYAPADAGGGPAGGDASDAPEYATVNAALGDLGPVGSAPDGARRLQAVELRPGALAVMWLALGESGPVLRGSLLLAPTASEPGQDGSGWTEQPLADVRLPHGFAGQFTLESSGAHGAALEATYVGPEGATTVTVLDTAHGVLGQEHSGPGHGMGGLPGSDSDYDSAGTPVHTTPGIAVRAHEQPDAGQVEAPALHSDAHASPTQTALAVAASPGVSEAAPIVAPMQDGFAIAWEAPAGTGDAVQITLTLYGEDGVATTAPILVAGDAAADVAPAITALGDGIAATYVRAGDGALMVKAFAGDGAEIGQEAVVDPADAGAITEIALGASAEDEIAVVYVRHYGGADSDAGGHQSGYGDIMLQRYGARTHDSGSELVELGRDGTQDGADAPVQLAAASDDPAAAQPTVGRAPSVTGVDDGELAIIWVEGDGGHETIRGSVLDRGGGQVLRIDLTDLLGGAGIAEGTKPTLLGIGDGDFLVSWLQPDGDGAGFAVMSALYSETAPGTWLSPEHAVSLKSFDSMPSDYSVAVSSSDAGLAIDVIWREDDGGLGSGTKVYSQTYDIDGHHLGGATKLAADDAPAETPLADDAIAAAGLPDGQIVVVYAEHSSDGDVDLAAQVFDVQANGDAGASEADLYAVDLGNTLADNTFSDNTFSTQIDEETTINPLAKELGAGLTISRINDVPISTATPVDVGSGWVQLREDGLLTVTPDAGYKGSIAFEYTASGTADGVAARGQVVVNVEASEAPAAVTLLNQVTAVAEDASTPADLKVADIAMADGELGNDGLSLTGLDAGMFKIVGNGLYLKQGIELDFETKPTLSIEIQASHTDGADTATSFTLNIESASDSLAAGDTFLFAPTYADTNAEPPVADLSDPGQTILQELVDSGALIQAGDDDTLVALDSGDLADPHKIAVPSDTDFKFS